jgi:putative ABC transport system permease protein
MKQHSSGHERPPQGGEWILEHLYRDNGDHTHLGDFAEIYRQILAEKGRRRAQTWYWGQILRSLPGFAANKVYWSLSMLRNYVVISFRNAVKNLGFSLIALLGLAIGLACFILILAYVRFELSYDRFHENSGRIYRVISAEVPAGQKPGEFATNNPSLLAGTLKAEFPEVHHAARIFARTDIQAVLKAGEKVFTETGLFVDRDFLQVFSFPLLRGDRSAALAAPASIVLTNETARKLFGEEDPLGQMVSFREGRGVGDVMVTGVVEDVPRNSHLQFDYLLSVATLEADKKNSYMFDNWGVGNFLIYVELVEREQREALEKKIGTWIEKNQAESYAAGLQIFLQPVEDIHLRSNVQGELSTNNEIRYIRLFLAIAVLTLLIAAINYMNIVTARSSTRAREIGIRKVTGANRRQLFEQFLGESVVFAFLSLILAIAIVRLALSRFGAISGVELELADVSAGSFLWLIVGVTFLTGIVSGAYPALVLSAFQPVRVLKEQAVS